MQQSDSLADGYTSRPSSGSPAVSTMVSARQQGLMAVESEARGAGTAIGIAANASTSSRQQRRRGAAAVLMGRLACSPRKKLARSILSC